MTGRYKAYPEYKNSGIEWVGDIPEHWEVAAISSYSTKITNGYVGPTRDIFFDSGVRYLQSLHIKQNRINFHTPYYVSKEWSDAKAKSILNEGDVLVVQTGDIGQVAAVTKEFEGCNCHALIIISTTKDLNGFYLSWLLNSSYGFHSLKSIQTGALHPHLNCDLVKTVKSHLPTIEEQQKIAKFLDHETAKIDTLIAKQEKLIELLKEKRQAVISHAVTKGLNPDAPMKDSGVEWLGEVPAHWDMKRLKYIGEARNGLTYSPDDVVTQEEGILVLRSSNIQDARLSFSDNVYVNMDIPTRIRTKENDLLICSRNGSRQLIGKNALITKEAVDMAFGAFMVVFRSKLNPYLYWVLNSPLFEYQSGSFLTSTINQLTIGNLASMEVPIPPECERKAISDYLIEKDQYFDKLTHKALLKVNLLKERKTALISAAVTGKIDVRDEELK
ncbi:restriction endonuclease subunit S [Pseudoalteromonas shioyasakiensis]|uniref:Restriction endonuclease subunit S n=1 Tax=Pseudoalteromonas shioyasakiensis TaxID=1190813 RepID=A0ABT6TVI6_9GAMM|nr:MULTISPECIES: restriction endonuclease subunit S [Pseudoalteromonas]MDI4667617.1 restriction endonuclease subunit S [Pseudoalteromonas shioyasakiensis]MDI4673152.1 restriction endonuclease subunit S [Pseudoalteromonas shioyasakiensis]MDI4685217.1 restriction endonuclease subunit S [Pseudoalteromonas shioyasakiensis]MDI4705056.1 restriction endonuclease subunit S [Pseudoalteromonas shioyasakiensis]NUJ20553.1 restriction endonuclease subunit S [Pseudoalteromonas sp. 0802]